MRLMISALEPSGCVLGAALARNLRQQRPEWELFGLGDAAMAAEGVDCLDVEPAAAIWLFSVLKQIPHYLKLLRTCFREMDARRPDALIVIDSSGFHFYLAKAAKKRGIRVIYYVSPQIWAYNSERIVKIRRWVDRLLVLYPFEETYYRERGVEAVYVGHPLFSASSQQELDLSGPGRLVGLLPGSRRGEVDKTLPLLRRIGESLAQSNPDLRFVVSAANDKLRPRIEALLEGTGWQIVDRATSSIFRAATLVVLKSGTTSLEAIVHSTPSLVIYRVSRFESLMARPWMEIPFIALPNLFAGREVLPEFLLHNDRIEPVVEAARRLLSSEAELEAMRSELRRLRAPFESKPDASREAGCEVIAAIEGRRPDAG